MAITNLISNKRKWNNWDHLLSTSRINCGSGSSAVQFGDHFRSGDHLRSGIIICGAFSHAPNKFIYTCSAHPSPPHPPSSYNVGHVYTLFLQSFNIVLGGGGGGGGEATHFKTEHSAFLKLMQLHKCPKEFCPPL